MKKNIQLSVLAVMIFSCLFAQEKKEHDNKKEEKVNVPVAVKQAFAKQYPGAAVKWEKEDGKYEAEVRVNGKEISILYEVSGAVAETETEIRVSELPAPAVAYLKQNHQGNIKGAAKIVKAGGEVNYEAELKGKDMIFDANGKFLKAVKD